MRWALACGLAALLLGACGRIDFDPESECGPLDRAVAPYPEIDGTFLICTAAQLSAIADHPEHWASKFRVGADIDLAGLAADFPSIGTTALPFTGTFDGGGHTISHLTIDQPLVDDVGMFKETDEGARFSNLRLASVDVRGHSGVGALAGYMNGLALHDISVEGRISAQFNNAGGLVAVVSCTACDLVTATNLSATIDIESTGQNNGGIFGVVDPPSSFMGMIQLSGLSSTGTITGNAGIGGLIGDAEATVDLADSTSSANVFVASADAGGLIGDCYGAEAIVRTSSASGEVRCPTGLCGGLVGYMEGTIADSHWDGQMTECSTECGGLAAEMYGRVTQSYATGTVTATGDLVGGLVGFSNGDILDSYSTGAIAGRDNVGGIVGAQQSAAVLVRTYSTGAVTGRAFVGGLAGALGAAGQQVDLSASFATGPVIGTTAANTVSPVVGALLMAGFNEVYSTANCTNTAGTCTSSGNVVGSAATFYSSANAPLNSWDFNATWREVPGSYPTLR